MSFSGLVAATAMGCSRGFTAPSAATQPPHIVLVSAEGGRADDGGALGQVVEVDGEPVVRGALHVVVKQDSGGPLSYVDFWTPGLPHDSASGSDLSWDVQTGDVVPLGGVMTVYVTPFDAKGNAGAALELSFVVDNQPPEFVDLDPAPGTPLRPGLVEVHFCLSDRPSVSALTAHLDDGSAVEADPAAGPHCFRTGIDAEPNGLDQTEVSLSASDDVGNVARAQFTYPVHRDSTFLDLPGQVSVDPTRTGQPVRAGSGYAVTLLNPIGFEEAWLTPDGAELRSPLIGNGMVVPVPGASPSFLEIDQSRSPPALQLIVDGGEVEDGGLATAAFNLALAASASQATCVAPTSYGPTDPVLCWSGSSAAAVAMPVPDGGSEATTGWITFAGGKLFVQYADSASPDNSVLAVYDPDAGFDRLPDVAGFPSFSPTNIPRVDYFGAALGPPSFGKPGSVLDAVELQASSFSMAPDRTGATLLGVAPGGEPLYAFADAARSQLTIASLIPDGGEQEWGCAPPDVPATELSPAFDRTGHLYLGWASPQGRAEVRAFSAPGVFAWDWSGTSGNPVTRAEIFLDPDQSAADPASTLLVLMPANFQYTILSRLDPSTPLPSPCR